MTATVISKMNVTHKQNSFKQPKWKVRIQNLDEYEEK